MPNRELINDKDLSALVKAVREWRRYYALWNSYTLQLAEWERGVFRLSRNMQAARRAMEQSAKPNALRYMRAYHAYNRAQALKPVRPTRRNPTVPSLTVLEHRMQTVAWKLVAPILAGERSDG